jgi:ubiquinone/menaquinone biosynthesis C-methylase UbiE
MSEDLYKKVVDANVLIHATLAKTYATAEPHFRKENVQKVENKLLELITRNKATKLLDLGCGTGFIINIAKKYFKEIDGVDVSKDMMNQVDKTGDADINLYLSDTGSFDAKKDYYDMVSGYSFLHHLYDINPTLKTAFSALKAGGILYCDLDPNFYYWDGINNLDRQTQYNPIVNREIEMVTYKDEDIENTYGVSKELFNHAEFGKNIGGGFKEEDLKKQLFDVGFSKVEINYYWYLGQATVINSEEGTIEERIAKADYMDKILKQALPLSRNLYKYLSIVATK